MAVERPRTRSPLAVPVAGSPLVFDARSPVVGAREDFLTGRAPANVVRPEIVVSWRRSALSGARPDVPGLPYSAEFDDRSMMRGAAKPVLDRLADRLDSTGSAFLLADETARIVTRWAGEPSLLTMMDRTDSAPGFALREEVCGTNGLGTVIEERRPVAVVGPEHFAERFVGYACHGAPIRHPVTGRLQGVLTFVCRAAESSPLMLAFVQETAGTIEDRMLAAGSRRERILLESYAAACRRMRAPLLAVNDRTLIASPAASRLIHPDLDHGALWDAAQRSMASRAPVEPGPPSDEHPVSVLARPVRDGDRVIGAIVELAPRPAAPGSPRPASSSAGAASRDHAHERARRLLLRHLGGRSRAWRRTIADAARALGGPQPVMVVGDQGTGKLELARALHELADDGEFHLFNAALAPLDGFAVWLGRIRSIFGHRGTLALTHLETLSGAEALALAALLDEHVPGSPRLVGTATRRPGDPPPDGPHLDRLAVHHVETPRLEDRHDDVPSLVERMLRRHGADRSRLTPAALRALTGAAWPGNVRQLDLVVRRVIAEHGGAAEIDVADLPADLLPGPRRTLTRLERLEMDAIVAAIRNADGDKTLAASELGLARSTLYRKLREYHIDV